MRFARPECGSIPEKAGTTGREGSDGVDNPACMGRRLRSRCEAYLLTAFKMRGRRGYDALVSAACRRPRPSPVPEPVPTAIALRVCPCRP